MGGVCLTVNNMEIREPRNKEEWATYYDLRWRILRAPWQITGPDRDETDDTSIHRMVCTPGGEALAVGRLHRIDAQTGQIRFMAVETGQERKGYGSLLLSSLEAVARAMQLKTIILQARENAVPFYEHHGYQVAEKTFLLFDEIQHYLMKKRLDD